jgi:translation initiation factor IF-3
MGVSGKIKEIQSEVIKGTFKSKNIIVTTDEQYPQHISIQFVQDKCDLLNNFNVGENVKIDINLRGREWTNPQGETVYFNTIQGWRIAKHTVQSPTQAYEAKQTPATESFVPATSLNEDEPDNLPF